MREGTAETYRVFVRNWWRRPLPGEGSYQNRVPDPSARKTTIATRMTYEEAVALCEEHARTHRPGPLSRKAEFERE